MRTTAHTCTSAAAALALAAILAVAASSALGAPGRAASSSYSWPVAPFDRQHPIRGSFGDPRTIFHGSPSARTLATGSGSFAFHTGVDIAAPDGTTVYPVVSGTVVVVRHDWLSVESGDRVFGYWHVTASVTPGEHVDARRTPLGTIIRGCHHVHLTERDGGVIVNPLQPGHLTPYVDRTVPAVGSISFRSSVTAPDLMPELLRGRVEIVASVADLPTLTVPGAWHDMPTTPALVTWRIEDAPTGKVVVEPRVAYDVRHRLPEPSAFWTVYARGTHQNMSVFGKHFSYMQPGVYLLRLAPGGFDTAALRDGVYDLVVTATDVDGNHGSAEVRFSVHNAPGVGGA